MKKSTWIIVGIFAVLLAAFLIYPKIAPSEEVPAEPTATPHVLQSLDDQALKSIIYTSLDGEKVQLDKVESLSWTVASHPEGAVTAGNIEEIIVYLSELKILSEVSDEKDLSEVGLKDPQQSIVFIYEDGSEYTIDFGDLTVLSDGYYALINGKDIVVLPNGGIDQIGGLFDTIIHPPTPTPELTDTSTDAQNSSETPTPSPTP